MEVIDYIPMNPAGIGTVYIRNPVGSFEVDWTVYFKPLETQAWIATVLFCLCVPTLMTIVVLDCKSRLGIPIFISDAKKSCN